MNEFPEFGELVGKTLANVENRDDEEIIFTTDSGEIFKLYHSQDCCEDVHVEDICGDLDDLVGSPILVAEEATSHDETPEGIPVPEYGMDDSFTWTFYKIDTAKGGVTIRWLGSSNGYYSESVDFERVTQ